MESTQKDRKVQGVILAAGPGLTLDPISTPKPLVRIGVTPLAQFAVHYLQELGITDINIIVSKQSTSLQKAFLGNK